MTQNKVIKISKKLSFVLRHKPTEIGLVLDDFGWTNTDELLQKFSQKFFPITLEELKKVVEENDKKRFAFNEDESKIRASQGHSISINLGYKATQPPQILYHGTASRFLKSIKEQGLLKQNRTHVHLSADKETALKVGTRHGVPVILQVKAQEMQEAGFEFFISENKVWLTDQVPHKFLVFP